VLDFSNLADASLVVLADHLKTGQIVSVDRKDFAILRWNGGRSHFYNLMDTRDRFELAQALRQSHKGGWSSLSHLWCGINPLKSRYFQVPDLNGCVLEFELKGRNGALVTQPYGMSNLSGDAPSGDADWRNTKLFVDDTSAHTSALKKSMLKEFRPDILTMLLGKRFEKRPRISLLH
jgi:hypothetical protein